MTEDGTPDPDDGHRNQPTVADLPELRPERWPEGASVEPGDLPPIDPERQAVRIREWEPAGDGETLKPVVYTLPRDQWAREAAYHHAAETVLENLSTTFEEGYKVWVVPPEADEPDDEGEVVVGYVVERQGGEQLEPDFSMGDLYDAVPDEVDGVAARRTAYEYVVEGIPVVLERTLE